jgi:5-methylcytosine-specific restriction endonuclease McrA
MPALSERQQMLMMQDRRCFYCARMFAPDVEGPNHPLRATIDHFIPKARGGR